ncbi:MAG: ABC transporter ATP-binding protein [Clostridiales bacterium]|nr:ABC transporter ATP-binding protein [Clostridiales bacterium]
MAGVTIRNVTKAFGDNVVLREFNQTFEDGEFITLLGPSGCGKTTMLRMIAGFEKPTSGEILIGDRVVSSEKVFLPPEKRGIGMVFQSYAVWPHMNVQDNVAYPLRIRKLPKEEIAEQVGRALETVHLSQYAERMPDQLSGGQQQRVALARALVGRPELLLLDEPLSNLDAKLRESMRFEIKEIQTRLGITVVYVTHDQTEAMAMSDRIILINRGAVQQVAPPAEIYNHPANQFVADFLGKVDFLGGEAKEGKIALDGTDQSVPYEGEKRGRVELAVRPERITLSPDSGTLRGVLETRYYLGDVNDCRVRVGTRLIRVIAPPDTYFSLKTGDTVYLTFREQLVFDEEGSLEEKLKIMT